MIDKNIIIFLMGNYSTKIPQIDTTLPDNLSKYSIVYCFEYPQFLKLINLIRQKTPLMELISPKLIVYHSIGILPFGRIFLPINALNYFVNNIIFRILVRKFTFKMTPITLTPEYSFLTFFYKIKPLYFVTDNFSSLPWWNNIFAKFQLSLLDEYLSFKAKKILAVTPWLVDKYGIHNKNTILFTIPTETGTNFHQRTGLNQSAQFFKHMAKPIIGFVGSIYDWKVDLDLLYKVVENFKHASFVFIGSINLTKPQLVRLNRFQNCFFRYIQKEELPNYIRNFDVCIIPYKTNAYAKGAYPVKILEYLSLGKPVVSTAIPSIKQLSDNKSIYWSRNINEFNLNIEYALKENISRKILYNRIKYYNSNKWSKRILELINIIDEK